MMVIGCVLKNWLGDVIFSSTAIRVIKSNFPSAKIICFAPKRCYDILKVNPYIDQVVILDEREEQSGFMAKWRFIWELRKLHIDQVYFFHRSFTRTLLFFLAGVKKRIGYNSKNRGFLLTSSFSEPIQKLHAVDWSLELLRRSGLSVTVDATYEAYFEKSDLQKVRDFLAKSGIGTRRLVAIHPGANWPHKRWPVEKFQECAKALAYRYEVNVIITGGVQDKPIADSIVKELKDPRIFSMCGETHLNELAALFSLCSLVISSDSGPLHIAGGVGTNVIAIFGPTDPELTGPRGRGKNIVIHHVPEGEKVPWYGKIFPKGWMEEISSDEVLNAIQREKLL